MLKFLIVESEQKCRHNPVRMAVSAPVFNSNYRECFAKISLQGYTMKKRRVIRGRIVCRIAEGRKIVFEAATNTQACIFECFV
jgi:hypothetical protein